jgi:hypothetical protein
MPSAPTVEERLVILEKTVAEILSGQSAAGEDFWSTFGMFENDPTFAEIVEEGRRIREAERRAASAE